MNYNFGILNETINNFFIEGFIKNNKQKKDIFAKYVKLLKTDKTLLNQFIAYTNLKNYHSTDILENKLFIDENLNLIKNIPQDKIIESNKKLIKLLKEANIKKIRINKKNKTLYDAITDLILENNSLNIKDKIKKYKLITEHLTTNKKTINEHNNRPIPLKSLLVSFNKKFNEKYAELTNEEKELAKSILLDTQKQKEYFNRVISEAIQKIDKTIERFDDENTINKLNDVKNHIANMKFSKKTYINNILKVKDFLNKII